VDLDKNSLLEHLAGSLSSEAHYRANPPGYRPQIDFDRVPQWLRVRSPSRGMASCPEWDLPF
jgi:hypothetical protein